MRISFDDFYVTKHALVSHGKEIEGELQWRDAWLIGHFDDFSIWFA
jgi:hypothetical protein